MDLEWLACVCTCLWLPGMRPYDAISSESLYSQNSSAPDQVSFIVVLQRVEKIIGFESCE